MMTTLTITRLDDETAEIRNERDVSAVVRVWADGSREVRSGARWLLEAARKDLGKTYVVTGLVRAMESGKAIVTRCNVEG